MSSPPLRRRPTDRARPAAAPSHAPGEVRLIGGQWKRSKLPVLAAPGLRPTPDRLRETLFNWLGHDLAGWRCLDAFAGSGALGFEAASRGAAEVLLLERDGRLVDNLRAVRARLGASQVQVECANALTWMARHAGPPFDLVLLDPPFDAALWDSALDAAPALLAPGGVLYLEADRAFDAAALAPRGYALLRHARAGQVHGHLLHRPAAEPA